MKLKTIKERKDNMKFTVDYEPCTWQIKAHEAFENHRFLVLACGQRTNKDFFTIMEGISYFVNLLSGNSYCQEIKPSVKWLFLTPTEKVARQAWKDLKKYFPQVLVCDISDKTMAITTVGNGTIKVCSSCNFEEMEDEKIDLVTITEASRIRNLKEILEKIEKKYGIGKAIINSSTPSFDFNKMWSFGQKNSSNYLSDWVSFKISTFDNPDMKKYYSNIAIEDLEKRYGKEMFRQEFMAEFVTDNKEIRLNENETDEGIRKRLKTAILNLLNFSEFYISEKIDNENLNISDLISEIRNTIAVCTDINNVIKDFK